PLYHHPAEISEVAVIVAAGIEREDVAFVPLLIRGRAIEARPRGNEAIVEDEPAARLLAPERLGQLVFGRARSMLGNHRQHGIDHTFGRDAQLLELRRALDRTQPLEHEYGVEQLASRE